MTRYLVWRVILLIPSTLVASIIVFGIMRVLPGDVTINILSGSGESTHSLEVREALREELGLDDSLVVQYGRWLWSMVNGEFGGQSLVTKEDIRSLVARSFPVTLLLAIYTIAISVAVSVPLGVLSAVRWNAWPDFLIRIVTLVGQAVPNFWVALLILLGLVVVFRWSPPTVYTGPWENPWNHLQLMVWPVLILAWEYSSRLARVTRSSMLEVLHQNYVLMARSKGLSERTVILRHALRNALVPTVALVGLQLGTLLSGALILESVFGIPGLGRGLVQAALARDYPVVQSIVTLLVFLTLTANLLVDLLYAKLDPRISLRA